ncbi:tetratricopeptide repeat protein [Streptomyces sp. NPDC006012]|uniref:tetratricopeptide repeat protein n=1 Tax=Streptomyces sp. NPDC006012 TaxID=3364739 RepID=UPI003697C9D5
MRGEYGDHIDLGRSDFHGPVIGKVETVHQHGPAPTALDSLPAGPPGFTGREPELRALLAALGPSPRAATGDAASGPDAAPGPDAASGPVIVLSGLGGIGKTALALRAAHQACERGGFPGGTLFVDLHGYDHTPTTADLALLSGEPGRPVHELAAELADCRSRIDLLDDGERSVRAAFGLSYRRLPAAQARLLRLLALMPGEESDLDAVTAALGAGDGTPGLLSAVERAHLVERGSRRGRHRLHDLVREYASGEATAAERADGRARVLAFCLRRARAADSHVRYGAGEPAATPFRDRTEALAWLDEERTALVAATGWAAEPHLASDAVELAAVLGAYLGFRRYFDDGASVFRAARAAAHRAGDRRREADAWNQLGVMLRGSGRLREAFEAARRAVALYHELRHAGGKGMAVSNPAAVLEATGRPDEAVAAFQCALKLLRQAGDRYSEAGAWNNLAPALRKAARTPEALDALRRALDLYQELGDCPREGRAWHNYAVALNAAGRTEEAVAACLSGLEICERFQDWHEAGQTRYALALVHETAGDPVRARAHWLRAAEDYERAGSTGHAALARRAARLTAP